MSLPHLKRQKSAILKSGGATLVAYFYRILVDRRFGSVKMAEMRCHTSKNVGGARWGKWGAGSETGGVDKLPNPPYCAAGAKGGGAGCPTSGRPSIEGGALPRTAKEARAAGSPRYFTGTPCKRGHIAERFTRNLTCTLCHNRGCPDRIKATRASYRFRQRFGVDISIKREMIERQDGRCAICGDPADALVLDHCHATGNIREALCNACNIALGLAGDDATRLRAMADYLDRHATAPSQESFV